MGILWRRNLPSGASFAELPLARPLPPKLEETSLQCWPGDAPWYRRASFGAEPVPFVARKLRGRRGMWGAEQMALKHKLDTVWGAATCAFASVCAAMSRLVFTEAASPLVPSGKEAASCRSPRQVIGIWRQRKGLSLRAFEWNEGNCWSRSRRGKGTACGREGKLSPASPVPPPSLFCKSVCHLPQPSQCAAHPGSLWCFFSP